jgi:hypothetical protein
MLNTLQIFPSPLNLYSPRYIAHICTITQMKSKIIFNFTFFFPPLSRALYLIMFHFCPQIGRSQYFFSKGRGWSMLDTLQIPNSPNPLFPRYITHICTIIPMKLENFFFNFTFFFPSHVHFTS